MRFFPSPYLTVFGVFFPSPYLNRRELCLHVQGARRLLQCEYNGDISVDDLETGEEKGNSSESRQH